MKALVRKAMMAVAMCVLSPVLWAGGSSTPEINLPTAAGAADWVPVVLLPPEQLRPYPTGAIRKGIAEGVLLGFLHVSEVEAAWTGGRSRRVQMAGQVPVMDGLRLQGMLAGSDFRPCIGLINQPELAPLRPDLCESFGPSESIGETVVAGLGAEVQIGKGWIGVSVQHAQGNDLSLALPNLSSSSAHPLPQPLGVEQTTDIGLSPLLAPFSSDSLNLNATLALDSDSQLGLGLALARAQVEVGNRGVPTRLDQGTLSFSLQQGNLTANLGTRVIDLPDLQGFLPWAGLDLGFSWRLPWQGVISVGAQNLITHGKPPRLLDPAAEETTESFSRVPYVRYHQDL